MPTNRDDPPSSSSELWQQLPTTVTWRELALAGPALTSLYELAAAARVREPERRIEPAAASRARSGGMAALFTGPREAGKSLAARVLAHELGRALYRVDLSAVVSESIGETEKNLREIFEAARAGGAILFFDEADALFGRRSEVEDSHDRYASLDASDLLRRIGTFEGLVLLATNLEPDLDPALLRRVRYVVEFPPPGPHEREPIRRRVLPSEPTSHDSGVRHLSPGVYVEELLPGARNIEGVATSITAFVGRTASGPAGTPTLVSSFADFERRYGGLALDSPLSYAVRHFFDNGGARAIVARITHHDATGAEDASAPITDADIADPSLAPPHRGLWQLDRTDLFNLLCIPPLSRDTDVGAATWDAAIRYARSRRAFVLVDPPAGWTSAPAAIAGLSATVARDPDAALYFPRILAADPLTGNASEAFAPCGAIAGLYARTDAQRSVWKAPAGTDATLTGVNGLTASLSDVECGQLKPQAINCLRSFPTGGPVVWGARTLHGADALASDWKYVPVRRLALFIEESLDRGTRWAVFEPNAEPLWAELRGSASAFLHDLWRQGAFQGATPKQAYFVRCDRDTTTQSDLDQGVVNLLVGFAPLKPSEFVLLRFALKAAAPDP
jgi:hypothetical protein